MAKLTVPPPTPDPVTDARLGWPLRDGGGAAIHGRAAIGRMIWAADGSRKAPTQKPFDRALGELKMGELEWICEFTPLGPIYLLPTSAWIGVLAEKLRELNVTRVLEVAAGDGFLSRRLKTAAPDLDIVASDSGAWEAPEARMNAAERREFAGQDVPGVKLGKNVVRMDALAAIRKYKPELVLASWLPPGDLLDQVIQSNVRYVLEIGAAGGVTPSQWSWRFKHELCEGKIQDLARCRLDVRPLKERHTRVTLYYGAKHSEHELERVGPKDWLWQFRPVSKPGRKASGG